MLIIAVMMLPGMAEPSGQDTNREAVNALPRGAIVAAEAAAAKVESASNETFMISGQQRAVNQNSSFPSSSCLCRTVSYVLLLELLVLFG